MRRGALAWLLLALPLGGCAVIAGVDQYQKGDCPGGCADGQAPIDGSTSPDGAKPDATADTGIDTGTTSDTGAGSDAASDAGTGSECGALNTIQNCTMCGGQCDTAHSNGASCNGTTCQYQSCQMGWSNCDTAAPDFAGCECNTPSCCGNVCQTTHQNGLGQSFYDCKAKNTYDQIQAIQACAAYTGNQNLCSMYTCTNPKDDLICGEINMECACWTYNGMYAGRVRKSANKTCYCPGANDPQWN